MSERTFYLYRATIQPGGAIYIGFTQNVDRRIQEHLNPDNTESAIQRCLTRMRKHGKQPTVTWKTMVVSNNGPWALNFCEDYLIQYYKRHGYSVLNKKPGGDIRYLREIRYTRPTEYVYQISKELVHLKDTMLAEALLWEQNPDRYTTAQYRFPKSPDRYLVSKPNAKKLMARQVRDRLRVIGRI